MPESKNHERAHSLVDLVMDAPWPARWILIAMVLTGGTGGVISIFTVPQRLAAMEQQVVRSDSLRRVESVRSQNASSYLRGEVNAIRVQISYFVCLDERLDDPARRVTCETINRQVQAILDAQARGPG